MVFKKRTFKVLGGIFSIISLFFVVACYSFGRNPTKVKETLEAKDYKVTVLSGDALDKEFETSSLSSLELEYYLYAEKGDDKLYLYYFYTNKDAEFEFNFIRHDGLQSGQSNNVLYFGTSQALEDTKQDSE